METIFVRDGKTIDLGQSMLRTPKKSNSAEPATKDTVPQKPPRGQKGGQKYKAKHPTQTAARDARKATSRADAAISSTRQSSSHIFSSDDEDDEPVRNPSYRKHAAAGAHVSSTSNPSPSARLAKKAPSRSIDHAARNSSDGFEARGPTERSGDDERVVGHESRQRDGADENDVDGPSSGLFEPLDAIDEITSLDEAKEELRFVRGQLQGHLDHSVQLQQRIHLLIDEKAHYKAMVDGAKRDTKLKLTEKIAEMEDTADLKDKETKAKIEAKDAELKAQAARIRDFETMRSAALAMQENERLMREANKSIKRLEDQLVASGESAVRIQLEAQLSEAKTEKEIASAAWVMSKKAVFGA